MVRLVLAVSALVALGATPSRAQPCAPAAPCQVADGQYLALPPAGWDGTTALPAALFFHGWQATAAGVAADAALTGAFSDAGLLLILPDGRDKTWAHVGSPSQARDELPFIDQVMADVALRYPLQRDLVWVTGFSQGGSMVWDLACYRGDRFAAFAPISGAFWQPLPDVCPTGPVNLRHVHGMTDQVVPMAGRSIRDVFQQGDIFAGMAVWRETNGCSPAPDRIERAAMLTCQVWSQCSSGKKLRLCLHDGGHGIPEGFVERAWRWVQDVTAAERSPDGEPSGGSRPQG